MSGNVKFHINNGENSKIENKSSIIYYLTLTDKYSTTADWQNWKDMTDDNNFAVCFYHVTCYTYHVVWIRCFHSLYHSITFFILIYTACFINIGIYAVIIIS